MTGEYDSPNILQQAARKIVGLAPVSAVLSRTMHHLDGPVLRRSHGRFSAASLITGLPIINLTAVGAKSGEPRTVPLVAIPDGEQLILIASNWGKPRHPSWYYNVKANPEVTVGSTGRDGSPTRLYEARELSGDEREAAWRKAVALYPGYAQYAKRNGGLAIPVVALRPKAAEFK